MHDTQNWPLYAISLSMVFLVPLLLWIGALGTKWIKEHTQNQLIQGVLIRAELAAEAAVREVGSEFVNELKAGASDGKLTKEEAIKALTLALSKVTEYLGTRGIQTIEQVLGNADKVLVSIIEQKVIEAKS